MKIVKGLRNDITEYLDQAYLEVLRNQSQPGRGNTKEFSERVLALVLTKGLDPAAYFEQLVLNTAEAHLETRSKKSPLADPQLELVFDPGVTKLSNAEEAIIRLGNGNCVSWANSTLDDLQVHQDMQLKVGLAVQKRSVITQSLIMHSIWEIVNRSRSATWKEVMQLNGFWTA